MYVCVFVKTSSSLNSCYCLVFSMFVIPEEGMQRFLNLSGKAINYKVSLQQNFITTLFSSNLLLSFAYSEGLGKQPHILQN